MSGAAPVAGGVRGGSRPARAARLILSGSLLLLFVAPVIALVTYPSASAYSSALSDPAVRASIGFTLLASGVALGVTLLFGVPLGHLLARRGFRGKGVIESAVALPVVVPHLVAGLALFVVVGPGTPAGSFLARLGVPIFDSLWGVVLVMVYVSAPYTVLASELAFRAVDPKLLEAARSLGASPAAAARTIALPLALRGVVAGGLLSWARSVSEIGGFLILAYTVYPGGGYGGPVTNPLAVLVYAVYEVRLADAVAIAALFVIVAFGLFLLVRLLERWGRLPWRAGELPL